MIINNQLLFFKIDIHNCCEFCDISKGSGRLLGSFFENTLISEKRLSDDCEGDLTASIRGDVFDFFNEYIPPTLYTANMLNEICL